MGGVIYRPIDLHSVRALVHVATKMQPDRAEGGGIGRRGVLAETQPFKLAQMQILGSSPLSWELSIHPSSVVSPLL